MRKPEPIPASVFQNPWHFVAFGFGSGVSPVVPGTIGTLLAIPFYLMLRDLSLPLYALFLLVFTVFSSWLSDLVSKEIKVHDHSGMNLDEFVGYFFTMIAAPHNWGAVWWGFILFRVFDMWKPFPINIIDKKVGGGFGMILDDIVAGIAACVVLQLMFYFIFL